MIAVALIQVGPQIWEALLSTHRTMPPTPCTLEPVVVFTKVWNDPAIKERIGCPISKGYITWLAEEAFEHGYMFWREDTDRIYTLYADHTWQNFADTWHEEDPEYSCPQLAPSNSPPTPKRGFGKVWCVQLGVREKLGWVLEETGASQ